MADPTLADIPVDADPDSETLFTMHEGEGHVPATNAILGVLRDVVTKYGEGDSSPSVGKILLGLPTAGDSEYLDVRTINQAPNGGQERWVHGTTIAVAAGISTVAGYGPDRFCLKTGATQASVISRVAGLTDGSQYAAKVLRNAGQTGTGVMVYEEAFTTPEVVKLRGDFVSIGLNIKAGANYSPASGNITLRVACGTGTNARRSGSAYTGETTLVNQTFALTGSAVLQQFVSSVIVPITATQLTVSLEWTPAGTAGADDSFTVDDIMLVGGKVPMAFRQRPDDVERCLEHYRKTFRYGVAPAQNAGFEGTLSMVPGANGHTFFVWDFGVEMWTVPGTITTYNPAAANANARNATDSTDTALSLSAASETNVVLFPSSPSAGDSGDSLRVHVTADARL